MGNMQAAVLLMHRRMLLYLMWVLNVRYLHIVKRGSCLDVNYSRFIAVVPSRSVPKMDKGAAIFTIMNTTGAGPMTLGSNPYTGH